MSVVIYSTTLLSQPTIGSATIDGSDQLVVSISRGSTEPDWAHYHLYYSSTPGIDITDSGTYDGVLQSVDGNIIDLGPWTAPVYLIATEVEYDGEESDGTLEYEISGAPAVEELTLMDTSDVTVGATGLDGSSAAVGPFTANGGTTEVTYRLTNTGDSLITVDYGTLAISGDGTDGDPSAGTDPVGIGEFAAFVVAFNTDVAQAGRSVAISFGHDGTDTPFTFTLHFDVQDEAEPGGGDGTGKTWLYDYLDIILD
jgi:hypothetical protein